MFKKYVSIKEASILLGVTTTTLRRWEIANKLVCNHRTFGNHRRYLLNDILQLTDNQEVNNIKKTICYARVSSHDQKSDLERQKYVLNSYCVSHNFGNVEIIDDLGSGLNFKKKGLNRLIKLIISGQVDKLILTHKDRLLRFGSDLIISLSKHYGVETIILNKKDLSFE